MRIDIISDVNCPWCYIGKRRLERALGGLPAGAAAIEWRPFQLNPDMPPEGMARRDYLRAKFGDERGGRNYDAIAEAGRGEGIGFAFDRIQRTPSTVNAHRLVRYAQRENRQDAMVEALFRAYFVDGVDVGAIDALAGIAAGLGLDGAAVRAFLAGDAERDEIVAEDEMARRIGVRGVPCFIIDRKFAISGAQELETFRRVFAEVARQAEPQPSAAPAG